MLKLINRRGFITTLLLMTVAPSALAKNISYAKSSTTPSKYTQEKLKPVGDQFVSVDGWILSTKDLTHGVV